LGIGNLAARSPGPITVLLPNASNPFPRDARRRIAATPTAGEVCPPPFPACMKRSLDALTSRVFDLAIVGGGITGCCIARDAARRGLSVALVERRDFSSGTSAATSHMVHGGLRYLQSLEFGVVRESLRERRIWQRIAPHLVSPLAFLVPTLGRRHDLTIRVGLALYDLLSFDRNRLEDPEQHLAASRHLSAAEMVAREEVLDQPALHAGMVYSDCLAFSPERVAVECALDAAAHGAAVANHVAAAAIRRGAPPTLVATDELTGAELPIRARVIVNAAGPWSDEVSATLGQATPTRVVRSKGIHLVVRPITTHFALTVPVRGRHFFVIPWRDHSLIGTTDTPYPGDPDDVGVTDAEIEDFLAVINEGLPAARLGRGDVVTAYAGLRPLVASHVGSTYRASRRSEIVEDPTGVVSVIGGKWTTSRGVAERCVDVVVRRLDASVRACDTADAPLPGGTDGRYQTSLPHLTARYPHIPHGGVLETLRMFGARAHHVLDLATATPVLAEPAVPGSADLAAAVVFAAREELAASLGDVLFRRTGLGALGSLSPAALDRCAGLLARELAWTADERAAQVAAVLGHYRRVSMLPPA
jgi:glycerol-3-phosphate dehydrogenase